MKKLLSRSALCILTLLLFACSSDSKSDSCTPITCLNGGTSLPECGCSCPTGFQGVNCGSQITPSKILVSKIRVNYFPNTDNGETWDASLPNADLAYADIYVKIKNSNNIELYDSPTYIPNVLSDGSNYFDFIPATPIQLPISSDLSNFYIGLHDFDGADSNFVSSDDLMGELLCFPYNANGGFPATITVSNTSTPLSITLTVSYVW